MWENAKLGDLMKIARGGSPRPIKSYITDAEDGVNWIKIGDTKEGGKYIQATKEKIKPSGISRSRFVKAGDFLLSNSMSFGRPYILQIDGCIHDGWLVLSDYENEFLADYLYYLLSSSVIKSQFETAARGSTVRNLNIELVSNVEVNYPPLSEQQRIVAKLDAVFAEIDQLTQAELALVQKYTALENKLVETLITSTAPQSKFQKIADLVSEIVTGPFGSALHKSDYVLEGIPVINPQNIVSGKLVSTEAKFISYDKAKNLSKYLLKANDVIIGRRGEMGRCAVIPNDEKDYFCGTGCMIIRPNENVSSEFLYELLSSEFVKNELTKGAVGATMLNLNQKILLNIQVNVATKDKQIQALSKLNKIRQNVEPVVSLKTKKLAELKSLKSAILKQELQSKAA